MLSLVKMQKYIDVQGYKRVSTPSTGTWLYGRLHYRTCHNEVVKPIMVEGLVEAATCIGPSKAISESSDEDHFG